MACSDRARTLAQTRIPLAPLPQAQLVVRLQPDEAIYLKMIVKRPGAAFCQEVQRRCGRRTSSPLQSTPCSM